MKTLTLTQPWATLVAIGAKRIETRSWNTNYRGALAIHAAKGFPKDAQNLCLTNPFRECLRYFGVSEFPLGVVVATCELISTHKVDEMDWTEGKRGWSKGNYFWEASDREKSFGDYSVGRYMWFLANVKVLDEPISAKGALGLWDWASV